MRAKDRLVHGVGINDADYPIKKEVKIEGKQVVTWRCKYYETWIHMLNRCYSEKYHVINPSYESCSVSSDWKLFSNFKAWMEEQDWNGKHLDKDILYHGNKIYSAEKCVFVPAVLNTFLCDGGASRGYLPIGVSKDRKKFRAQCRNPFTGKQDRLGSYLDQKEAHEAWRAKKHEHACRFAEMQTDQRIANALRVRYAGELK